MHSINKKRIESRFDSNSVEDICFFRTIALDIDKNPRLIEKYYHIPSIIEGNSKIYSSCYELVKRIEALAYGDASVCLARPSTALSGVIVKELADQAQMAKYNYICQNRIGKTFFAMTEPSGGSKITTMSTRVNKTKDGVILNGEKCLVGGAFIADIGVVVAKQEESENLIILLITSNELNALNRNGLPSVTRYLLPQIGLKGAEYSHIIFDQCFVPYEQILGMHLKPFQRGIAAVITTLNSRRPFVAAMAITMAQAILDYYADHSIYTDNKSYLYFEQKLSLVRSQLYEAAKIVDSKSIKVDYVSMVKLQATKLLESIIVFCINYFGKRSFIEHPMIAKWYRDAFAFEFLEGTTPIQKENIYLGYIQEANKYR